MNEVIEYLEKGKRLAEKWDKWILNCPIKDREEERRMWKWLDKKPKGERPHFSVPRINKLLEVLKLWICL